LIGNKFRAQIEGFNTTTWVLLVGVFILAAVVRLVNLSYVDNFISHAFVEDSPVYWEAARYWLESGYFSRLSDAGYIHETERVPGYILFLIPFRALWEDALFPVLFAQALIDAASCAIICKLGTLLSFRVGVVAGLLAAVWYNLFLHSSLILTETIFLFLMCLILLCSAHFILWCRLRDAALVGLICGAAIMTRSLVMFLPLAVALTAPLITHYRVRSWRKGGVAGALVICCAALPAAPIAYRNISQFDTLQLTSQNGTFFLNWVVGVCKSLESGRGFDAESAVLSQKLDEQIDKAFGPDALLNNFQVSSQGTFLAREEISAMPVSTLINCWLYGSINSLASPAVAIDPRIRQHNTKSFYNSSGANIFERAVNFLRGNAPVYVSVLLLGLIFGAISLTLQVAGWALLLRAHVWAAVFGMLYILYFLIVSGPVGNAKYRIPIEPLLIIFQSFALTEMIRLYLRRATNIEWNSSK